MREIVQRIHAFTQNCVEGTHIGDLRLGGIVVDEPCLVGQPYTVANVQRLLNLQR